MPTAQFPSPLFSTSKVNWAGKILCDDSADPSSVAQANVIIDDWRASHRRPPTHMNVHLRNLAKSVRRNPVIAQRLKRTPSIRHKLERIPKMQLSRMQDIGGCRIVLSTMLQVRAMVNTILQSRAKHQLAHMKDYISNPKESGYRSIHLIYRYHSDTFQDHCGLMVEIQVRTQLQHVWATGVETVGTFLRSPLKSSIGPDEWLEFFSRFSSVLHIKEHEPRTYKKSDQFLEEAKKLGEIAERLDAQRRLSGFGSIIKYIEGDKRRNRSIYLLNLKPVEGIITVYGYSTSESAAAISHYRDLEQDADISVAEDVVLVNASSVQELRKAYPNYFMDTRRLVRELHALAPYTSQ